LRSDRVSKKGNFRGENGFMSEIKQQANEPQKYEVWRDRQTMKKRVAYSNTIEIIKNGDYEKVCDNPHDDGDFSYLCAGRYCRCQQ
jgi:hypothetical protein